MVVVSFTLPHFPIFAFVITTSTLASHLSPALCCNLLFVMLISHCILLQSIFSVLYESYKNPDAVFFFLNLFNIF